MTPAESYEISVKGIWSTIHSSIYRKSLIQFSIFMNAIKFFLRWVPFWLQAILTKRILIRMKRKPCSLFTYFPRLIVVSACSTTEPTVRPQVVNLCVKVSFRDVSDHQMIFPTITIRLRTFLLSKHCPSVNLCPTLTAKREKRCSSFTCQLVWLYNHVFGSRCVQHLPVFPYRFYSAHEVIVRVRNRAVKIVTCVRVVLQCVSY